VTLVDTNVLLDLLTGDPKWADWSLGQLDAAALRGPLVINEIGYAELSVRFATIEALDSVVAEMETALVAMPRAALFLAAKVFQRYRSAGGTRRGMSPDFFIGAHAAVLGCTLLSRDPGRYRVSFPGLALITPPIWDGENQRLTCGRAQAGRAPAVARASTDDMWCVGTGGPSRVESDLKSHGNLPD
jgi:predicted nucleic acid-binding protein